MGGFIDHQDGRGQEPLDDYLERTVKKPARDRATSLPPEAAQARAARPQVTPSAPARRGASSVARRGAVGRGAKASGQIGTRPGRPKAGATTLQPSSTLLGD